MAYFSVDLCPVFNGNVVACVAAEHLIFKLRELLRHSGCSSASCLYVDHISLLFAFAVVYTNEGNLNSHFGPEIICFPLWSLTWIISHMQ